MKQDKSTTRAFHQPTLWGCTSLLAILAASHSAHAQNAPTPIPDVSVTSPAGAQPAEGSEAAGYKPDTVSNLGPLGRTPILDTPYSVNVISAPLIENMQASRPEDLYKIDPVLQTFTTSGRGYSQNFIVRGFSVANGVGTAEDGMVLGNMFNEPLEDKERLEVYTGLTSFLYGPTNVGGMLNYVYKRPTDVPLASVTIGDYGGLSGFTHGDFGGPIDKEGRFSYRLNIVGQDGDTAVNFQSIKRDVLTAALTWHISPDASLTFIGSHYDQVFNGGDVAWSFAANPNGSSKILHSVVPDPALNFGEPFTTYSTQRDRIGTDLSWKLNDIFTARASYAYSQVVVRDYIVANNSVANSSGLYSQTDSHLPDYHFYANTGYAFIDANFDTFFIHHKLTTGFYGNDWRYAYSPTSYAAGSFSNLNFVSPTYFPEPGFAQSNIGPARTSSYTTAKNFVLGDEIKFNEYLSALVGGNYTVLSGDNFNLTNGSSTSAYDQGHLSPSLSLIFKPVPFISTYATYSESLQPGQAVVNGGSTIYTNNGQVLAPFVGREFEIGAKANVGGMLLTASLFQIEQALQYASYNGNGTYTYVQDGRERVSGLELTATGNVFEGFRILGGVTLLNPRDVQNNTSPTAPSINGYRPPNVALSMEKITAEYDLPFAKGLTLTGGFYYTGEQAVDRLNTEFLPGFTTEDLGFRYRASDLLGQKLPFGQEYVLRFNVTNIANNHYWLTQNYVGQPRTFMASAQVKF